MPERAQSFESHTRWLAPFHFFVLPVLLINIVAIAKRLYHAQDGRTAWELVVAVAILIGIYMGRHMALTMQDRLIRLEERLRLQALLPADQRARSGELTRGQYVALRFAPDEEVPELVRRIPSGELKTAGDIKRAIRNWRADHIRV